MAVKYGEGGQYISLEVDKLLDDYCKEVEETVLKVAAGVSKATANKLRKRILTAPRLVISSILICV